MTTHARDSWRVSSLSWTDGEWRLTRSHEIDEKRYVKLWERTSFVRELSRQRPVEQLVTAVTRWRGSIANIPTATEGPIEDPGILRDLSLDLAAFVRVADLAGLGVEQNRPEPRDPLAAGQLSAYRDQVRASRPYLACCGLAERAARGDLTLSVEGAKVCIDGYSGLPEDLPTGLLGFVVGLTWHGIRSVREEFEEAALEIEQAVSGVDLAAASPVLVAMSAGEDGDLENLQVTGLPIAEIEAIRAFLNVSPNTANPLAIINASQRLAAVSPASEVQIGNTDITASLHGGRSREGLDTIPEAEFEIDLALLGSSTVDYWGSVRHGVAGDELRQVRFTGAVQDAEVQGSSVKLRCEGAVDLTELQPGGLVSLAVGPGELITSMAEQAGLSTDAIVLSEPAETPSDEVIEVTIPVLGILVETAIAVGAVKLVPPTIGRRKLDLLEVESEVGTELVARYREADCYAVASIAGNWLQDAEARGLKKLSTALSWLTVRARFGLARLPDGVAVPFSRQAALRSPQQGDVVLVAGSASGRVWLRRTTGSYEPLSRQLEKSSPTLEPDLPARLPNSLRLSLVALANATQEREAERQLQGMWSAIEFYVSGVSCPASFKPEELKMLEELFPNSLSAPQRDKFQAAVRNLNNSPLVERLKAGLLVDGVVLSRNEEDLLFMKLRRARNDVVHGREIKAPPSRAEMNCGFGLVARMLVHRVARLTHDLPTELM